MAVCLHRACRERTLDDNQEQQHSCLNSSLPLLREDQYRGTLKQDTCPGWGGRNPVIRNFADRSWPSLSYISLRSDTARTGKRHLLKYTGASCAENAQPKIRVIHAAVPGASFSFDDRDAGPRAFNEPHLTSKASQTSAYPVVAASKS